MQGTPQKASSASQVEAVLGAVTDSWNRHDMAAFAAQFALDADFVNVVGMHWSGRTEIEAPHAALHRSIFRNSVLRTLDQSVRFIDTKVALAHVHWEMKGHDPVPGLNTPEIRQGIMLYVLVEDGGQWRITAAQNTEIVPVSLPK